MSKSGKRAASEGTSDRKRLRKIRCATQTQIWERASKLDDRLTCASVSLEEGKGSKTSLVEGSQTEKRWTLYTSSLRTWTNNERHTLSFFLLYHPILCWPKYLRFDIDTLIIALFLWFNQFNWWIGMNNSLRQVDWVRKSSTQLHLLERERGNIRWAYVRNRRWFIGVVSEERDSQKATHQFHTGKQNRSALVNYFHLPPPSFV